MSRSSIYGVLFGAVFASIALDYTMATVDPANVIFIYYNTLDSPGVEVTYGHVNPRRAVYIIPSWNQKRNETWIMEMKTNTMTNSAADVIVVDWSRYHGSDYLSTCPFVQGVGEVVGNFASYSDNRDTQFNGFAMGAHVAGIAGKRVETLNGSSNKIPRIIGLNPSKQCFEGKPSGNRLDVGDAIVVQVFHTSSDSISYMSGTVAVFFNCGLSQPGCTNADCHSLRAVYYFSESINHKKIIAFKCGDCLSLLLGFCLSTTYPVGGRGTDIPGRYLSFTTSQAPWYIV